MSDETHEEERTILALLDALGRAAGSGTGDLADPSAVPDADPLPRVGDGEAGETLARLSIEVLGLLPYALEPVVPPRAGRQRLMAIVAGEGLAASASLPTPADVPPPVAAVPPPARQTGAGSTAVRPARPAGMPSGSFPPPYPRRPPSRARRWPLALAAGVVLALLGVSSWQFWSLEQQRRLRTDDRAEIAELRRELQAERERNVAVAATRSDRDRLRAQMGDLERIFALVTSPTVEMSAMRPTGRVALASQARGRIYIAEDHQHWYLSVEDLAPSGAGREYQLWFFGEQGPVSGGSFDAQPGRPIRLTSERMPHGIKAIVITLEPTAGAPTPSGPEVLRAMPPIKVL